MPLLELQLPGAIVRLSYFESGSDDAFKQSRLENSMRVAISATIRFMQGESSMQVTKFAIPLLFCAAQAALAAPFGGGITSGNLSVWRINEGTGQVSLCSFENKKSPASCAPWSTKEGASGDFRLIVGNDLLSVWRLNRQSGAVSLCEYKDVNKEPVCTPWNNE